MKADKSTLKELMLFSETHLRTEINRLSEQNKSLLAENEVLHRHNQALHNCWQEAIVNYSKGQKDLRASINQVAKLTNEVDELQAHLNPKEIAA